MWSIYYVDNGKEEILSTAQAKRKFGPEEWVEIAAGYLPHIVVCKID